ncbi:tyrosine-type recombinase/integrase [Nitrososphaera sp.]|uniref:tyrosine-type recombinase/integrase n=1 Tax=Nitrososphaera sp. TaxID=1971748 RepID=UPI002ED8B537
MNPGYQIGNAPKTFNKQEFIAWLQQPKEQGGKGQELDTAKNNACSVGKFIESGKSPEEFVNSYANAYTYNGAFFAVNHWCDYTGQPRLRLKQRLCIPKNLIIAPKVEEMQRVIREIKDKHVKAYIALCATTGLRPKRLLKARWHEIDFTNGWVNINERHGKKVYRPNPLHQDVARLLQELKQTATSERIFDFTYHRVVNALKSANSTIRPNNCRDFFYNYARKSGADRDQIDWLAGHSLPGVRAHYLADELKQEYAKFEQAFRLL